MSEKQESYGDRPAKLIAAFRALDSKKSGRIPTPLVIKVLTSFDDRLTDEEKTEFLAEADDNGFVVYEKFVNDVIFGKVK